jgi:hypothetical protein
MKYKVSPHPSWMTLGSEPMPIPWIVKISPWLLTTDFWNNIGYLSKRCVNTENHYLNSPVLLLTFLYRKFIQTSYKDRILNSLFL